MVGDTDPAKKLSEVSDEEQRYQMKSPKDERSASFVQEDIDWPWWQKCVPLNGDGRIANRRYLVLATYHAQREALITAIVLRFIELYRIESGVPHRGGQRQRGRQEGLHLIEPEAMALEPQRQLQHVFVGRAGVGGDEVGNQVLFFTRRARGLIEQGFEALVTGDARLHHRRKRPYFGVLSKWVGIL